MSLSSFSLQASLWVALTTEIAEGSVKSSRPPGQPSQQS